MIVYFSATGNSQYVAQRISNEIDERIISITECMERCAFQFEIQPDERVGIISPTYAWGLPSIVVEFLERFHITSNKNPYVYFIATYGTTPGQTGRFAREKLQIQNINISAFFSIKMPDTWTPIYDLSDLKKVKTINEKAESQINFSIAKIKCRTHGDFMERKIPYPFAKVFYCFEYDRMRKTNHFHVENSCIGCGICARKCPVHAIKIRDKKPIWIKEQCIMCLGCLHRCPKFSIQYENKTKEHGQYLHPNVKL